jgi:hypothetical protein
MEEFMGYMHISNVYKDKTIMLFKECYAMEKIHGTSADVSFKDGVLTFFSGGESHDKFVKLFDQTSLIDKFKAIGEKDITVYGEAYGGSQQGMSATYGKELKFIVFDININYGDGREKWLNVPEAEAMALSLGLEFVHYEKINVTIEELNRQMLLPSVQAKRNGIVEEKKREGVVLRPLVEMTNCYGERVISKHKREDFQERKTQPSLDAEKLQVLEKAEEIANEWVTNERLNHILQKLPQGIGMDKMQDIMKAMVEDIEREAKGEIVESKEARKAIGKKTVDIFKNRLKSSI